MLAERLKRETQRPHQELEKMMIPQIKSTKTTAAYMTLLKLFYGYYKPLEDRIEKYIGATGLPDYDERRKAELITDDLKHIGNTYIDIEICENIPNVDSVEDALGMMYVLEG